MKIAALLALAMLLPQPRDGSSGAPKSPPPGAIAIPAPTPPRPFTVVVAMADDLGLEDLRTLSAMGGTPYLDYVTAHGFSFSTCVASPICSPSRRQFWFGDWHTRVAEVCQDPDGEEPPLSATSFAELLPWVPTALFGKWHVGASPTGGPWELAPQEHGIALWRGLPHYVAGCGGTDYFRWPRVEDGAFDIPDGIYQPLYMLNETLSYLDERRGGVVVFASHLPHEPYQRPPIPMLPIGWGQTITDVSRFHAMIAAFDYSIGRILEHLGPDDILIVCSDNGTPDAVAPAAFRGKAKTTTFERGLRVPLIAYGGWVKPGKSSALVALIDLYATIPELFGVQAPPGSDGRSLLPVMLGLTSEVRSFAFAGVEGDPRFPGDVCARSARYKLRVLDIDHDGVDDLEQFYDLQDDPTETVDRIGDPSLLSVIQAHRDWLAQERP